MTNQPPIIPDDPEYHLPKGHWPLPELSNVATGVAHPPATTFVGVQKSAEFQRLRSSFRAFAFPTVVAVLVWYFLYVLLSIFAQGFMGQSAFGNLTLGMVMGLLQFPTTWFATWLYVRRAGDVLDPMAAALREKIEAEVAQ